MPAYSIIIPARIKNGIASKVNFADEAYITTGNIASGKSNNITMITVDKPRDMAMGIPKNKNMKNNINNNQVIIKIFSYFSLNQPLP
jgi:hypothetical protein